MSFDCSFFFKILECSFYIFLSDKYLLDYNMKFDPHKIQKYSVKLSLSIIPYIYTLYSGNIKSQFQWGQCNGKQANPLSVVPAFQISALSSLHCSISSTTVRQLPGKVEVDDPRPQAPASLWEIWWVLLDLCFRWAQHGCGNHLGSESLDRISLSLSLLPCLCSSFK